ncbi:hypothetical protein GP486_001858 [Trichoglossum hirsutum]|uniref:Uncharacterized protein n=1 Tax=Trichoglossum hirsutum TaxID=265104 RepID=A0A9P8LG16_9PEZI|nr:hypothetical protein GP486_001858 [Trichoglossum hirsutum]
MRSTLPLEHLIKRSPAVKHVNELFSRHWEGTLPEDWVKASIRRSEYPELLQEIAQNEDLRGYVEDKIRFDYDPDDNWIAIRMPTAICEYFTVQFQQAIVSQFGAIADQVPDYLAKATRSKVMRVYFYRVATPHRTGDIYAITALMAYSDSSVLVSQRSFRSLILPKSEKVQSSR